MDKITLKIGNDDEITLPAGIAASSLALDEIGAIAVMACLECDQPNQEGLAARMKTPELMSAMARLKDKGVFKVNIEAGEVTLKIDLEAVGL